MAISSRTFQLVSDLLVLSALYPAASYGLALSVTKTADLDFGRFIGGYGHAGRVTVDPFGRRTASGSVKLLDSSYSPASFMIVGNPGTRYTLRLPPSLALRTEGAQADVSNISASIPTTGVLPSEGILYFKIGGMLTIGPTQHSSRYSGDIVVSVE